MFDFSTLSPVQSVVVLVCLMIVALIGTYVLVTGTPPTASSPAARKTMIGLIPEALDGPIFELGSSWGTLAVGLARRVPWCRVIGIEMSPIPYWVSLLMRLAYGAGNLELLRGNFHHFDLSSARVVTMFLSRGAMRILRPKLNRELKPGTLVITNAFTIPGWEPIAEHPTGGLLRGRVYVYRMGEGTDPDAPILFDGR